MGLITATTCWWSRGTVGWGGAVKKTRWRLHGVAKQMGIEILLRNHCKVLHKSFKHVGLQHLWPLKGELCIEGQEEKEIS